MSSWSVMALIWGRLKGASRTAVDTRMLFEVLPAAILNTLYCRTGHAVRLLLFHGLEQQVQGEMYSSSSSFTSAYSSTRMTMEKFCSYSGASWNSMRMMAWSSAVSGLGPERIGLMAALGCGGLDEIIHQLEGVLFVPEIAEGVIAVRLLQVDQIQHPDVIALAFEVAPGGGTAPPIWGR